MIGSNLTEEWVKCYCGGEIRSIFTCHKRTPYGWIYNHYKKPRWQIDNCYPKRTAK